MIYEYNKSISSISMRGRAIQTVYHKGKVVWIKLKTLDNNKMSCYYNGYWIDEYPWTDDTPWQD